MFMEERHQEISDIIKTNGKITIAEMKLKIMIIFALTAENP